MSASIHDYKYIRTKSGFYIWPTSMGILWHKHMAAFIQEAVISAGFVYTTSDGFTCHGESESLGVKSLKEDSALLNQQMNIEMG